MALSDSAEAYESALQNLIQDSLDHHVAHLEAIGGLEIEPAERLNLLADAMPAADNRLETLSGRADDYLAASQQLEADLDETPDSDERLAALLSGHLLAANSLLAAMSGTRDEGGVTPLIGPGRRAVLVAVAAPPELGQALLDTDLRTPGESLSAEEMILRHARDHDLADVMLGILGEPQVAGGSADEVAHTVSHVVEGLAKSVNKVVTTAAGSLTGGQLAASVAKYVNGTQLGSLVGHGWKAIKSAVVRVLDRAVALSRKLIGTHATKALESLLRDEINGLIVSVEGRALNRLLRIDDLNRGDAAAVARLDPAARGRLEGELAAVSRNYDKRARWGDRGAITLGLLPAALATPVVTGLVAVALLAYQAWSAIDYLDWPDPLSRGLLDRAAGVKHTVDAAVAAP
jgi:hypothetical protein